MFTCLEWLVWWMQSAQNKTEYHARLSDEEKTLPFHDAIRYVATVPVTTAMLAHEAQTGHTTAPAVVTDVRRFTRESAYYYCLIVEHVYCCWNVN